MKTCVTHHICDCHKAKLDTLEAENAKLREALQKYADGDGLRLKPEKEYLYADPADKVLWVQRSMSDWDNRIIARAALGIKSEGSERDGEGTVSIESRFLPGRPRFDRPGWTKPMKGDRPPIRSSRFNCEEESMTTPTQPSLTELIEAVCDVEVLDE